MLQTDPTRVKTWYISGHLDLTESEFLDNYADPIREAYERGEGFVVGDAPGCDEMAQRFLGTLLGARYRIFHMFQAPRRNATGTQSLVGGFQSDEERDAAMTRESDADIAWVRPGKSKRNSGTAKNLRRRLERQKQLILEGRRSWPRFVVSERICDDGTVDLHMRSPDEVTAEWFRREHGPIPCPPGLYERYVNIGAQLRAAEEAYYRVQHEIRSAQVAAEMYKEDEGTPPPPVAEKVEGEDDD